MREGWRYGEKEGGREKGMWEWMRDKGGDREGEKE